MVRKVLDAIDQIICSILAVMTIAMVGSIILQVIFRYGLNRALVWPEAFTRFLFVWTSILGAGLVYRRLGGHIGIDLSAKLSHKLKKVMNVLITLGTLFFLSFLIIYGAQLAQNQWNVIGQGFKVRVGLMYLAIPIGAVLMSIFAIEALVEQLKHPTVLTLPELLRQKQTKGVNDE